MGEAQSDGQLAVRDGELELTSPRQLTPTFALATIAGLKEEVLRRAQEIGIVPEAGGSKAEVGHAGPAARARGDERGRGSNCETIIATHKHNTCLPWLTFAMPSGERPTTYAP